MSADLGAVQAGFVNNFAYGTISLTSSTSVELVDQSHNTSEHEPRGRLCRRADRAERGHPEPEQPAPLRPRRPDQRHGRGRNGHSSFPSGGSIALNTPTPGTLIPAGAVDDWTFYGTAGESITVQLNPGGSGSIAGALAACSTGARSRCSNASGNVLASASSASSGAIATISGFTPAGQRHLHDPGPGPGRAHCQHRQLRPLGLQRDAQRQPPDGQPAVHRHDPQRLWRRPVGLHRRGRPAGPAERHQHVRRQSRST